MADLPIMTLGALTALHIILAAESVNSHRRLGHVMVALLSLLSSVPLIFDAP